MAEALSSELSHPLSALSSQGASQSMAVDAMHADSLSDAVLTGPLLSSAFNDVTAGSSTWQVPSKPTQLVGFWPTFKDAWVLTKPGIIKSSMVVSAGSMTLVHNGNSFSQWIFTLLGIAFSVAGAGALNMLVERDLDRLMTRTRERPLADRRMHPLFAALFGGLLSLFALAFMYQAGGTLGVGLTLFAQFSYLLVYTPMKRVSWWALVVGAIPGALPILMGTAALTGKIEPVGLALAGMLFFWQLPHFIAISIYRESEYTNAGYPVLPLVHGHNIAVAVTFLTTILLVACSFVLLPIGVAGPVYAIAAFLAGGFFLYRAAQGFRTPRINPWARKVFLASLVHQVVLFGALVLDVGLAAWL
ncbi:MAG: protoheme IX farnesyltransferase [Deltaproteobacteria bacterium]|nr:protoheme IX farnesyltransferase [Deltaproteobacteria bacterium]